MADIQRIEVGHDKFKPVDETDLIFEDIDFSSDLITFDTDIITFDNQ